jgi:hypothetical protein
MRITVPDPHHVADAKNNLLVIVPDSEGGKIRPDADKNEARSARVTQRTKIYLYFIAHCRGWAE